MKANKKTNPLQQRYKCLCQKLVFGNFRPLLFLYLTVAVQIYFWFKFYLSVVLGCMVMYDNEFETMENKI